METMLVVVVIGLMSAIALPSLTRAYNAAASRTAADAFVRIGELGRATAMRFGRDAELHITAGQTSFFIDTDTSGAGQRAIIGGIANYSSRGLTLTSTDTLVCFDMRGLRSSRGNCNPGPTTLVFSGPGRADTIVITTLGKVVR
jgi:type II secretory pathway pseudopilin PulG